MTASFVERNKKMKGFVVAGFAAVVAASVSLHARGGTLCYGESEATMVDIDSGTRTAAIPERIRFSTGWENGAGADAVAVVEVNGEILSSETGVGFVDWTPRSNGVYVLTHRVMSSNVQIGETLTAMFAVEGLNPEMPVISPVSGTTFDTSLSVSISCPTEGATIHYTTDGSDPTVESPVYRRFRIYGKTTVKAIAEKDGKLSEVATSEYALGQCANPVFSLTDGAEFAHSNRTVYIRWESDGVLRYTLDGSDPTSESPIYEEPFSFSDSVELRAKVFSDDFFDSAVVTSRLTRVWENVSTPQIDAAASFTGSKTKVVISCAVKDASIHYTLDGSEPDFDSAVYAGPIYVTDSCTVKAYAVMPDYLDSAVATQAIVKIWAIGDAIGKPDHDFTTGENSFAGWAQVEDPTAPNGIAMKSGEIAHDQFSVLETRVMGPGTLTFSWRTSCEEDPGRFFEWDHVELAVDGTAVRWLDGESNWSQESVRINGSGEHLVEWRYVKDNEESEGEDAAWVAGYGWLSDYTETQTTEVPVPYAWLTQHDGGVVDEYDSYETAAKATAANGRKVWTCYMLGLDPEDETDDFKITSFLLNADGTPNLSSISFYPPQSGWNVSEARPVLKGIAELGDGEWQSVSEATEEAKASFRFFRIDVELP